MRGGAVNQRVIMVGKVYYKLVSYLKIVPHKSYSVIFPGVSGKRSKGAFTPDAMPNFPPTISHSTVQILSQQRVRVNILWFYIYVCDFDGEWPNSRE